MSRISYTALKLPTTGREQLALVYVRGKNGTIARITYIFINIANRDLLIRTCINPLFKPKFGKIKRVRG